MDIVKKKSVNRNIDNITIVMMCHNRVTFLYSALTSIIRAIKYSDLDIHFYISDNSSNDDVGKYCKRYFPEISYIKRKKFLTICEHHNLLIKENNSNYFMMLHDDDIVEESLIQKLYQYLKNSKKTGAVASNAKIIDSADKTIKENSFRSFKDHLIFIDQNKFLTKYFAFYNLGIAPFPSYMYKADAINNFVWNEKSGGKYCDVTMLAHILDRYEIAWINKYLFNYREHKDNGNKTVKIRSKILLFKTLKSKYKHCKAIYKLRFRTFLRIMVIRSSRIKIRNKIKLAIILFSFMAKRTLF